MKIDTICALLIETLLETSYNESTIFNYQGVIRRFKVFCREKGVTEYTPEFGKTYGDDVIRKRLDYLVKIVIIHRVDLYA